MCKNEVLSMMFFWLPCTTPADSKMKKAGSKMGMNSIFEPASWYSKLLGYSE